MDTAAIIAAVAAAVKAAVDLGPIAIKTVQDAEPFAELIVSTLLGKNPTDDEIAALEAQIAKLSQELQAELPPEQPDDV